MDTSVTLIEFDYFFHAQSNLISLPSKHHLKQNILDQIFFFPCLVWQFLACESCQFGPTLVIKSYSSIASGMRGMPWCPSTFKSSINNMNMPLFHPLTLAHFSFNSPAFVEKSKIRPKDCLQHPFTIFYRQIPFRWEANDIGLISEKTSHMLWIMFQSFWMATLSPEMDK